MFSSMIAVLVLLLLDHLKEKYDVISVTHFFGFENEEGGSNISVHQLWMNFRLYKSTETKICTTFWYPQFLHSTKYMNTQRKEKNANHLPTMLNQNISSIIMHLLVDPPPPLEIIRVLNTIVFKSVNWLEINF